VADFAPTDIRIPAELRPGDGRFGSGPSKIRPEGVADMLETWGGLLGTSHRQDPVRNLVGHIKEGLATLWDLPEGHQVVLGNGGSSLFWDVATLGLIRQRSQHVVFGEFGAKFALGVEAAPFLERPELVSAPAGTRALAWADSSIDLYALVHNETSTGVLGSISRPPGSDPSALIAVDATSAAGGVAWDPAAVDVYYFAPQKCFASDGGLWLAVLSPAAVARVAEVAQLGRWVPASLDLGVAIEQSALNQTLNTPAIVTLALLATQLDWMLDHGGLDFAAKRSATSAAHLYGWATESTFATPFVASVEHRSPVVGTIDLDAGVSAATVAAVLRANGIVDTEPYRKLGRNQLRIGMFPAVDPSDVEALTACIDHVVGLL
jgi:phosphoserine aminotransferase